MSPIAVATDPGDREPRSGSALAGRALYLLRGEVEEALTRLHIGCLGDDPELVAEARKMRANLQHLQSSVSRLHLRLKEQGQ